MGCSVCPCDVGPDGQPWASRNAYLRCVKGQSRRSLGDERLTRTEARDANKRALVSTCGRHTVTRCCLVRDRGTRFLCRVTDTGSCDSQRARGVAVDAGGGSCLPNPCGRP